jgi:hypothetical protein
MKKILCLTDFSKNANNGALYANKLAKKISSKLIFMHTYELIANKEPKGSSHPSLTSYSDTESRDNLYRLCMDLQKEDKYCSATYEYIVNEGNVTQNINSVIKEHKIDLLILSIEGELKPQDTYYGNIVSEIVQIAQCPVLVVPSNASYENIETMVYAFDIEKESTLENDAISLARLFNAKLKILSCIKEENKNEISKIYSEFDLIKKKSGYDKISFDVKATQDIKSFMNKYIIENKTDLLILENHKRILYKRLTERSFTKSFIFLSKVPVLIIRSKEN